MFLPNAHRYCIVYVKKIRIQRIIHDQRSVTPVKGVGFFLWRSEGLRLFVLVFQRTKSSKFFSSMIPLQQASFAVAKPIIAISTSPAPPPTISQHLSWPPTASVHGCNVSQPIFRMPHRRIPQHYKKINMSTQSARNSSRRRRNTLSFFPRCIPESCRTPKSTFPDGTWLRLFISPHPYLLSYLPRASDGMRVLI